jgi:deoxycytidylate deaminase
MEKATKKTSFLPSVYCNVFGHDFEVTKKVTYYVKEYTCSHCKKQLTTSGNGKLTELTPKFKEINAILERIHNVRIQRSKEKSITSSI